MSTFSRNASDLTTAIGPSGPGFAFAHGADVFALLRTRGTLDDWSAFADSWNRLETDTYMADGGRYRRRRYATFSTRPGHQVVLEPHQPHYQTIDYNPLNGGVARWFEPIEPAVATGSTLTTILGCCRSIFSSLLPHEAPWHIEVHQFRIEARTHESGRPTPEGLHRDGVDYVLVLLVERRNIASGVTSIHALTGERLGAFTLTDPGDAAFVDDARVAHGVTPVTPLDPTKPACRDVLVVTFRKAVRPESAPV